MTSNWWGYTTNQLKLPGYGRVTDYASARALVESVKPLRGDGVHDWRPLGHRSRRNVKQMRLGEAGDAVFRLYATEVVTWHPDDTLSIEGYPTRSTAAFAERLAPPGVYLTGETLVLPPPWYDKGAWRWQDRHAVRLPQGHKVRLKQEGDGRWAADLGTLVPWAWPVLDRKAARQVSDEYRLREFTAWRRAYEALGGLHKQTEKASYCALAALLHDGRFLDAYHCLPHHWGTRTIKDPTVQPWGFRHENFDGVSDHALARFRAWLYVREGATRMHHQAIVSVATYWAAIQRNRYT